MINNKLIIFLGIVVVSLIGYSAVLINKNKSLNKEIELSNNNINAYKGIINKNTKENAILRLDIKQMKESGDSMIMSLEKKNKVNRIQKQTSNTCKLNGYNIKRFILYTSSYRSLFKNRHSNYKRLFQ